MPSRPVTQAITFPAGYKPLKKKPSTISRQKYDNLIDSLKNAVAIKDPEQFRNEIKDIIARYTVV